MNKKSYNKPIIKLPSDIGEGHTESDTNQTKEKEKVRGRGFIYDHTKYIPLHLLCDPEWKIIKEIQISPCITEIHQIYQGIY